MGKLASTLSKGRILGEGYLIFVTVGSGLQSFNRLLDELDSIAKGLNERVMVQTADPSYVPKNFESFSFLPKDQINEFYKKSNIVVSHAGIGSIITAFSYNKPLIIVPRRKEYGELVDNHQAEIAKELEKEGRAKVIWDIKELEQAIRCARTRQYESSRPNMELSNRLAEYISSQEGL